MASTVQKGDAFEDKVFSFFADEIRLGRFYIRSECCRVFKKKKYFSKDRSANIIFDVVIEVYTPGTEECALLLIIECKDHKSPIDVGSVEAFYQKAEQVAGAGSKLIFATAGAVQKSARNFAKSKKMGLLRYFDPGEFKWEAHRSPSMSHRSVGRVEFPESDRVMSEEDYKSRVFDLFFETRFGVTASPWDFFDDLLGQNGSLDEISWVVNDAARHSCDVPFLGKLEIEEISSGILHSANYRSGLVDLDAVCSRVPGLAVERRSSSDQGVLGVVSFDPLTVTVYDSGSESRDRFTLAHEISHVFLGHGRYIKKEICEIEDIESDERRLLPKDIARIEWQANYLASCVLMPKKDFHSKSMEIISSLGIRNRGFGYLYLDDQACNQTDYMAVTGRLMRTYGLSRRAVHLRLEDLGFLQGASQI